MLGCELAVQQFGVRWRKRHSHPSEDHSRQDQRKSLRNIDRRAQVRGGSIDGIERGVAPRRGEQRHRQNTNRAREREYYPLELETEGHLGPNSWRTAVEPIIRELLASKNSPFSDQSSGRMLGR
jgi:hypothetical protein